MSLAELWCGYLYCQYCGAEESLPFRCAFCHGYFCTNHRLPEQHLCSEAQKARTRGTQTENYIPVTYRYEFDVLTRPPRRTRTFWFSSTEIMHVIVGIVLVSAVGLSIPLGSAGISNLTMALPSLGIFTAGFILHELSHKFVAQLHGLWAEFRLTSMGVIITAISVLSPVKFIAPGMVMIAGSATSDTIGKLAVAGPMANLAISLLSTVGVLLSRATLLRHVFALGCWVNAYMALFNLIPFGQFDGLKVFRWSKPAWITIVGLAVLLLFASSYYIF